MMLRGNADHAEGCIGWIESGDLVWQEKASQHQCVFLAETTSQCQREEYKRGRDKEKGNTNIKSLRL